MISPYLEKPLRTLDQALHERVAGRAALQDMPLCRMAQPPTARSASDAGSAEALALLLRECPAIDIATNRRAA